MEIEGLADLTPEGSGGFSQVFRATQTRYHRTVAAKVLNFRLEDDADRERFEQECRAMAQLSDHPHIVPLYSTTYTSEGYPVIVMEYFAGGTLLQRARGGASRAEMLDAGVKIASALQCAHQRNITHRDVKPQNVLLSSFRQPALTDFGISAITRHRATTEQTTGITIAYAAPEALDGLSSARTDTYSLAATLYTVLAGQRPFEARPNVKQSTAELVLRIMHEDPPSLQQFGLSSDVDRTIRRIGMARDPQDRPATAREFGELLRTLQRHEGLEPTPWIEAVGQAGTTPAAGLADGDESITVIRSHRLETKPSDVTPQPTEPEPSAWTKRRIVALVAGAIALAALTLVALWAGGRGEEAVTDGDPTETTIPTADAFYSGPLFPPTDITIERSGNGTAIVVWTDPNDPPAEFEIQRVDAAGRDDAPIVVSGVAVELPNIGDTESPCITMRAVRDLQTSAETPAPICAGAVVGGGPLVAAVPPACAPGACDFRLDASGFFPGGTVSIEVEDPTGVDLNSLFGEAYEARADVRANGDIDWRFSPGNGAPAGAYRVTVIDNQSGLSTVTFLTLTEG